MGTRGRILCAGVGAVVLAIIALLFLPRHSPERFYRGKSYSWWVKCFGTGVNNKEFALHKQFELTPPEAVPVLVEGLRARDSRFDIVYRKLWEGLPRWSRRVLPAPFDAARAQNFCLMYLTQLHGPESKQAIPAMIELANASPVRRSQVIVWLTLQPASKEAMLAILKFCSSPDPLTRSFALGAFRSLGAGIVIADPERKDAFLEVLGAALKMDSVEVHQAALSSLANFGPDARQLAPAVTSLANDPDLMTRQLALYALARIEPESRYRRPDITKLPQPPATVPPPPILPR